MDTQVWMLVWVIAALVVLARLVYWEHRRFTRVVLAKPSLFTRGLQMKNKYGNRLVYVRVEVNGEGFLYEDYEEPALYPDALAHALAGADKWLHEYTLKVGTKEAR